MLFPQRAFIWYQWTVFKLACRCSRIQFSTHFSVCMLASVLKHNELERENVEMDRIFVARWAYRPGTYKMNTHRCSCAKYNKRWKLFKYGCELGKGRGKKAIEVSSFWIFFLWDWSTEIAFIDSALVIRLEIKWVQAVLDIWQSELMCCVYGN